MPSDVDIQDKISKSRDSASWVLSRDSFLSRFHFSANSQVDQEDLASDHISTGQPLLTGEKFLRMGICECSERLSGNFKLHENPEFLIGTAQISIRPETLESKSHQLYLEMLKAVGERSICRIWNYVPGINEIRFGLLENYKLFCSGRSKAFAEFYGEESPWHFPAASATGCDTDKLTVVFIATSSPVENWENPEQTPAYLYPSEYGPRAPAFARASRFNDNNQAEWIFVSGTASIKGCETQHKGDFSTQMDVTLNNIDLILSKCGLALAECSSGRYRHFMAFLRDKEDLKGFLDKMHPVMGIGDTLTVVEGDICREDLEVEIELTVFPG